VVISGSAVSPPDDVVSSATAWVRKPFDLGEIIAALAHLGLAAAGPFPVGNTPGEDHKTNSGRPGARAGERRA
jgi:hypothetical protein